MRRDHRSNAYLTCTMAEAGTPVAEIGYTRVEPTERVDSPAKGRALDVGHRLSVSDPDGAGRDALDMLTPLVNQS